MTALEILSEPLVFLVLISALALSVLAPAMHYHEFGAPDRMARDAGVSALLLGGLVTAAFGAVKTMRREIESQTAMTALALPVSRRLFFLSKFVGVVLAYGFFVLTVFGVAFTMIRGSMIGGELAARNNDMPRIYGPAFALAVATIVLPFVYGALVSRIRRRRFTLNANLCALAMSVIAFTLAFDGRLLGQLLPLTVLVVLPGLVLMSAALAFSARFRFNTAMSLATAVFVCFLPALGNYCLTDVISAGETIGWGYCLAAVGAILPLLVALGYLGIKLFEQTE